MNNNWQTKILSDVINKVDQTTKINRKNFLTEGKFPVISQEQDFINGYWNSEKDLFAVSSPVVIFGDHTQVLKYVDFDFVLGADGVKILQPKPFLDAKYFFYFLLGANLKSLGYARHYRILKDLEVSYPESLEEQKRIVKILDEAFEKVTKAKENSEKNLLNSIEIFDSCLKSTFLEAGSSWECTTVEKLVAEGSLYKPQDGNHGEIHPKRRDYVEQGVPFLMACDLINGSVDTSNSKFITKNQAESLRTGFAKDGDILLSHKATIGRVGILRTSDEYVMLTPQLTYYRVKDANKLYNRFIYYYFLSPDFQDEIYNFAKGGSTRAYIGITKQLKLTFIVPPIQVQKEIVSKFDVLSEQTKKLEVNYKQKIADLDELKKSLLTKAFAGEL